jgi:hypothetical protein
MSFVPLLGLLTSQPARLPACVHIQAGKQKTPHRSPLLDLAGPPLNALAPAAHLQSRDPHVLHAQRVGQPLVRRHATRVGPLLGDELQHRGQEVGDALGLPLVEVVLLLQHVRQRPVAQAVDVTELALACEDLLRPLARQAEGLRERAEQLDYLRDVVVVFAILGARLGVEEVVAGDQFKGLRTQVSSEERELEAGDVP